MLLHFILIKFLVFFNNVSSRDLNIKLDLKKISLSVVSENEYEISGYNKFLSKHIHFGNLLSESNKNKLFNKICGFQGFYPKISFHLQTNEKIYDSCLVLLNFTKNVDVVFVYVKK